MFYICFYRFSTEELRLATGALRRLSLAKKEVFVVIYRGNREGTVHCFLYINNVLKNYKPNVPMSCCAPPECKAVLCGEIPNSQNQ